MTRHSPGRTSRLVAVGLCLAAAVSACGVSTPVDKKGAPASAVTELVLGTGDPVDLQLSVFVDAVDRLSEHRLRIRVEPSTWNTETPGGEAKLTGDVRAGVVPLGYIPSRDLATDGAPAFQALHAPFLAGTTPDAIALATSPIAKDVLASLEDRELHGLALIPLESRRLISRRPILAAGDLTGTRIRINDSAQTARLISAWSAIPVQGYLSAKTLSELTFGRLDAIESSPTDVVHNNYFNPAPYLTSFGMFPKVEALVVNQQAWTGLSDADRKALEAAAARTVAHAATDTPVQEAKALSQLCARGLVVVRPPEEALGELRALAEQAQPVDTQAIAWSARLRGALASAPTGSISAPPPSDCPVATSAAQAENLHYGNASSSAPVSATADAVTSSFPIGTYTTFITKAQWKAADVTSNLSTADVTYTSTFGADGTFTQTVEPNLADQGPYEGTYRVTGDRVVIDYHLVAIPTERYVETVTWSYLRGELHFVAVDVLDTASQVMYRQPWRKIG